MTDLISNNPFASAARQFAQSALTANTLAFEGFERIVQLQLKSVEAGIKSSVAFMSEAAEVSDMESAQAILPKGASLLKESSEQLYATSQEVLGEAMKTSESIGQVLNERFQAASESISKAAASN